MGKNVTRSLEETKAGNANLEACLDEYKERFDLERQEKELMEAKIEEMRNQALVLLKEEKLKYETRLVEAQDLVMILKGDVKNMSKELAALKEEEAMSNVKDEANNVVKENIELLELRK